MRILRKDEYINVGKFKIVLYLLGFVSFTAMVIMKYDSVFKITMLLPVCYMICVSFFVKQGMGDGIGAISIIVMYAFRMCVLPILCAYGNFWLEPAREVYIGYYGISILLSCFECALVFGALSYFYKYYTRLIPREKLRKKKNIVIAAFLTVMLLICGCLYLINKDFILYFRLIFAEKDGKLINETVHYLQSYGSSYYLLVVIDLIIRPIIAFVITGYFIKNNNFFGVLLIGIINFVFVTDRRIISFLIGGCCIIQLLLYLKQDLFRKIFYVLIGVLALITIGYCFYGTNEAYLVARKFQRYFSGPTLTAIGIAVNRNFSQGPIVFLKLLFNDSILLTGLFHSLETPDYVMQLCGPAGYSIWTPMMIGSIQYFSVFAPVAIVLIVHFVAKCDYAARNTKSNLHKLMMNYLSISVAVYMIMYTVELIFYTIIFFGSLYKILIWADRKIKRKE